MGITARGRWLLGSVVSFVLFAIDVIERADVLENFGFTLKPDSAAARLLAPLAAIPPVAFGVIAVCLGLVWVSYPTLERVGPSWIDAVAGAWWTIRGRQSLRRQTYRLAGALRRLAAREEASTLQSIESMTRRWAKVSPTYWAVKKALQNHLGANHPLLSDLRATFPLGSDHYRHMASLLEQIAPLIPAEAEAVPVPKRQS